VIVDVVLAWLVQAILPRQRYGLRVLAAAAIALGPSFVISSASEAQLDAVAILPGVVAVLLWQRGGARRALWCGLLLGLGAAIKVTPALLLLALLPTAVSRRESVRLLAGALAVPAVLLVPFATADWGGTTATLRYTGFPGAGGIAVLVQPGLAGHYLGDYDLSSAYPLLQQWGWLLTAAGIACAAMLLFRARVAPIPAAAVLWLTVYATSVNWYPQYLAWGFPFLLLAGYVVPVAVAELILTPTLLLAYRSKLGPLSDLLPSGRSEVLLYTALMDFLWLAAALGAIMLLRRVALVPRAGAPGCHDDPRGRQWPTRNQFAARSDEPDVARPVYTARVRSSGRRP
jgi:hypothetical protein